MNLRNLLLLTALAPVVLIGAPRPNVLLIYLDDLGWRDTGFMGSDFYETPHLDALAEKAMVFTNAYSGAANCAPARACLMSGQYSPRHKVYNVGTGPRGKSAYRRLLHVPGTSTLDSSIVTWANLAQDAGYVTATMGKWHLSDDPVPFGFELNIGGTHSGGPPKGYYPPHGKVPGLQDVPPDEYLTDSLSTKAIEFITKNQDREWLLYLTHFAVHTPLQAKRELLPKYKRKSPGSLHQHATMATMIQAVDDGVGRIIKTLNSLGLTDNTIILFYSDNGGYGPATDMDPLKGYKGTYYEGGIRVPFFVYWPEIIKSGRKTDAVMTGVDIYPTLVDMMQLTTREDQVLDGISLVPLLKGQPHNTERSVFWHFPAYLQSYKGLTDEQRDPLFRSRPCSVIRKGNWKLHFYYEDNGIELYDLSKDIGENTNLADAFPEIATMLKQELDTWLTETNADLPLHPNPEFDPVAEARAISKAKKIQPTRQP